MKNEDWIIQRIIKTEKRPDAKGKMVEFALVDWEETWVPRDMLALTDEEITVPEEVEVEGPLEEGKGKGLTGDRLWVITIKKKGRNPERQSIRYDDLRSRFRLPLLDYFESCASLKSGKSSRAKQVQEPMELDQGDEKENRNRRKARNMSTESPTKEMMETESSTPGRRSVGRRAKN